VKTLTDLQAALRSENERASLVSSVIESSSKALAKKGAARDAAAKALDAARADEARATERYDADPSEKHGETLLRARLKREAGERALAKAIGEYDSETRSGQTARRGHAEAQTTIAKLEAEIAVHPDTLHDKVDVAALNALRHARGFLTSINFIAAALDDVEKTARAHNLPAPDSGHALLAVQEGLAGLGFALDRTISADEAHLRALRWAFERNAAGHRATPAVLLETLAMVLKRAPAVPEAVSRFKAAIGLRRKYRTEGEAAAIEDQADAEEAKERDAKVAASRPPPKGARFANDPHPGYRADDSADLHGGAELPEFASQLKAGGNIFGSLWGGVAAALSTGAKPKL
jgi:hypothetical protein